MTRCRSPRLVPTALVALGALALGTLGGCASSGGSDRVMTAEEQKALTPSQILTRLKDGNERFVAGDHTDYDLNAQVVATANGQYPKAIILGCLDSRVPPEKVFDVGIGEIFVGRVAGNFENVDMLGSFEFGAAVAGSKVIVVLGHTGCGAVKGAIDRAQLGNLTATLANIEPAIVAAGNPNGERSSSNTAFVNRVITENVRLTVNDIRTRSPVLAQMEREGNLMIVGGVYDLATGRIDWMD